MKPLNSIFSCIEVHRSTRRLPAIGMGGKHPCCENGLNTTSSGRLLRRAQLNFVKKYILVDILYVYSAVFERLFVLFVDTGAVLATMPTLVVAVTR